MIVEVTPQHQSVTLRERDVFTAFHVEAATGDIDDVLTALGANGAAISDDHVWINVDAVRRWASSDDTWEQGFSAMLAFAAGKGWLSEDERMIQAHVEWCQEA